MDSAIFVFQKFEKVAVSPHEYGVLYCEECPIWMYQGGKYENSFSKSFWAKKKNEKNSNKAIDYPMDSAIFYERNW